jgi:hypothetical protein
MLQTCLEKRVIAMAAVISIGCLAAESRADLNTGLRNYWAFDDNANDSAGDYPGTASTVVDNGTFSGANGTAGIAYAPGKFGNGIEQNGAAGANQNDGFVLVNRSADTLYGSTSTVTTSMWVKAAGFDTSWQTMLAHGEGSQYRIARRGEDNVASYAGGSGDIPGSALGPVLLDEAWHHVVAISEGGVSTRLWVDGGLVATGDPPTIDDQGNSSPADPNLYIGANPQTGDQNREWWGGIDDVAQWDRALDESEIGLIHSSGVDGISVGQLVPEPSSALLLLLGTLALGRRSRKR